MSDNKHKMACVAGAIGSIAGYAAVALFFSATVWVGFNVCVVPWLDCRPMPLRLVLFLGVLITYVRAWQVPA